MSHFDNAAGALFLLVVATIGCSRAAPPSSPKAGPMASFEHEGYRLSGAEYWPYIGKEEPRYPEDVLWGFYPEKGVRGPGEDDPNPDSATPAAIACAERAWSELKNFLAGNPPSLRAIVERGKDQGYTPLFYLWVNDYSRAADPYPHEVRPAKLWYWKRKVPDPKRPAGYWKWESTLTRDGRCETPRREQMLPYLENAERELGSKVR